jgi:hypothetical protein
MGKHDWIPHDEGNFAIFAHAWAEALEDAAKIAAFGWDPGECSAAVSIFRTYLAAFKRYTGVNSAGNRLVKDEAKAVAMDVMREFAAASIRGNKKMPDSAKLALGIRARKRTHTRHKTPESVPSTEVGTTAAHYQHRVYANNPETGESTKPDGVWGVCYGWQVGGEKPTDGADLPKSKFSRRTRLCIHHTEADAGKRVHYSTCYQNVRGDQGQWSPVMTAYIG